jgi:hypothetical protein
VATPPVNILVAIEMCYVLSLCHLVDACLMMSLPLFVCVWL